MALGDNTTSVARGMGSRGRQPYFIQHELNFATAASDKGTALAANDVIPGLTIPANTVILHAGFEVTEAHAGTSTDTDFHFGITGGDLDNFDTIDIEIQAMTGTTTGGKLRLFAICMDIDDIGSMAADEVDRDTLA